MRTSGVRVYEVTIKAGSARPMGLINSTRPKAIASFGINLISHDSPQSSITAHFLFDIYSSWYFVMLRFILFQ